MLHFLFKKRKRFTLNIVRKGFTAPLQLFKAPTPSLNKSPIFKILFAHLFFTFHPRLRDFIQFPQAHPTTESTILVHQTSIPTLSYCRYLFPATNNNHLNPDETNQTNIVVRRVGKLGTLY